MRTRILCAVTGVVCFLTGVVIQAWRDREIPEKHWARVRLYRELLNDPENYDHGLFVMPEGIDESVLEVEPNLAHLVALGELEHAKLIFPGVPDSREAGRLWMDYVQSHPNIIEAFGNPRYRDFEMKGTQPLFLELWFRPEAIKEVQGLIRLLEDSVESSATSGKGSKSTQKFDRE